MISIIHNVYSRNEYIRESIALNVKALQQANIDFQYIIFNDNGDKTIEEDVKETVGGRVEYYYSKKNFGMKVCSGGWVGAIPLLKGTYIHNIGQDDVFTPLFYTSLLAKLEDPKIYLAYANGFKVNSSLILSGETLGPLVDVDYSDPRKVFNQWFQRKQNTLTAANNYIPAPGVVYKKELHTLIGEPDLINFKGSADFEYWARVLFNNLGVVYDPKPLWLYRISEYSLGTKPLAERETPNWNNLILQKYQIWLTQLLQAGQVL